jgi:hypothetical protein
VYEAAPIRVAVIGAMSSVASHDSGDAMFLGLLGGAAAMGAALAFRRPTEAERLARQAKRDARREARLARRRQADPGAWEKPIAIAVVIAIAVCNCYRSCCCLSRAYEGDGARATSKSGGKLALVSTIQTLWLG